MYQCLSYSFVIILALWLAPVEFEILIDSSSVVSIHLSYIILALWSFSVGYQSMVNSGFPVCSTSVWLCGYSIEIERDFS